MKCYTKNKNNKRKKKVWIVILIISSVLICLFSYFKFYVNPIIFEVNKMSIKSKTTTIINQAVQTSLNGTNYDNLINISKDSNGKINSITANSMVANQLNLDITNNCQNMLNQNNKLNFDVPLGSFSGIPFLNGIGPKIKINMIPIGVVQTNFNSQFTSCGINQTYHKISLIVSANICVLMPTNSQNIVVNTEIIIAESIIIGEIPQAYLSSSLLSSQLNLIP